MPMCYGTVGGYVDGYDMSSCSCSPNDPALARSELGERAATLLFLLRSKRRARRVQRVTLDKLLTLVRTAKYWRPEDCRRNGPELESLVMQLIAEHRVLAQ